MISPLDFLKQVIARWEGGYQSFADDMGNWIVTPEGARIKIGTMRGVTPSALASHRGVLAWSLTPADMQAVTLDEAAAIGFKHYYVEPHFDKLVWGPATAALLDFGWGAGPGQATLSLQRMLGIGADGVLGSITAETYNAWEAGQGWGAATTAIHDMRAAFYRHICDIRPANTQYLQGWLNRDDWCSSLNADWFKQWGTNT